MFYLLMFLILTFIVVLDYTRPSYLPNELNKYSWFKAISKKSKYRSYHKYLLYMFISFIIMGWLITSDLRKSGMAHEDIVMFQAYAFTMIIIFTLLTIYTYFLHSKVMNMFYKLQDGGNIDLIKLEIFDTTDMEFKVKYYDVSSGVLNTLIYVSIFLTMLKGSMETITVWFTILVSLYVVRCILNIFKLFLDRSIISQLEINGNY